jgi:hypothetical protein
MKWAKVQKSVRWYMGRGTERTLEKHAQGVEKKGERRNWRRHVEGRNDFKQFLPRNKNEDREIDHILRIFRAYEVVTTSTTV